MSRAFFERNRLSGLRRHPADPRRRLRPFLKALDGVTDPETERKTIGALFIDVFETEAKKIGGAQFLAQGTLYPDVIG